MVGGKKVKPEEEEKIVEENVVAEGTTSSDVQRKDTTRKDGSKEDGKHDQFVDAAADQQFSTSVGVETSSKVSETNATVSAPHSLMALKSGEQKGPESTDIFYDGERPVWNTRFDFVIFMIGFALDLSNVWRFPWLCFKHKGLVFLLPYFLVLVFCAFPVFYLELIVGQYVHKGAIEVWRICPLFRGVGYATVIITYIMIYAYNIALTWTLHFAIKSWIHPLPWATCQEEWNTKRCVVIDETVEQTQNNGTPSGYEYFHGQVLERYDLLTNTTYSILNMGGPVIYNYVCLTIIYVLLIIFLVRGMKNTVKVMWYASGIALVMLCIMVFRSITLPGSTRIFSFLIQESNIKKLSDVEMWVDAASQVFYSTGIGFGVHLTLASLNPFHHYILRDCIIVITVNVLISCLSLVAVCGFLGAHAYMLRKDISAQVFNKGPDIFFEMFPDALARLPAKNYFAFSFYLMLFILTFSCVLAALQGLIMGIQQVLKSGGKSYSCKSYILITLAVGSSYGFGLISLTRGGYDIYNSIDDNLATSSLLLVTFIHVIAISWFYGVDNICKAVHDMYDSVPNLYLRICWKFVSPLILLVLFMAELYFTTPAIDKGKARTIKLALGHILTWFQIVVLIFVSVVTWIQMIQPTKWLCLISPDIEHQEIRKTGKGVRSSMAHWKFIGTRAQMRKLLNIEKPLKAVVVDSKKKTSGSKPNKKVGNEENKEVDPTKEVTGPDAKDSGPLTVPPDNPNKKSDEKNKRKISVGSKDTGTGSAKLEMSLENIKAKP